MARLLLKYASIDTLKFCICFSPVLSHISAYFPNDPTSSKTLFSPYTESMFYSYGQLESASTYITNSFVEEGDVTLLIHKYGHNVPKFVSKDMSKFGQFLKKCYSSITGEEMSLGKELLMGRY
jgi:hypothetical protein